MIGDAIAMLEFISKKWDEFKVISAYFSWDGRRIDGDERLKLHILKMSDEVWIYNIEGPEGYAFVRIPASMGGVIESVEGVEDVQTHKHFLDSRAFRYVKVPDGHIFGGTLPNVKVDVMVFGYKPSDLLKRSVLAV